MKTLFSGILLLSASALFAQPLSDGNDKMLSLLQRYQQMKTSSETYADYKVIKENLLDRTWKIANDSIKEGQKIIEQERTEIARLENEVGKIQVEWKAREATIDSLEFYGSHIAFLGVDFGKKTFISLALISIIVLLAFSGVLVIQLKNMYRNLLERSEVLNTLGHDFEEYKRKALEKQTKLSRELQNERNRIMELKKI